MLTCGTVDYLTITAKHHTQQQAAAEAVYEALKHDDVTNGLDEKPAQALGYKGQKIGTMFLGHNVDGTMFRVSGALAHTAAEMLSWIGGNHHVTRLDVQLTWAFGYNCEGEAETQSSAVHTFQQTNGRRQQPARRLILGYGKGDTLTIGSRTSEVFVRVYDKSREQMTDPNEGLWRYEVELKGERAQQALDMLYAAQDRQRAIFDLVDYWMRDRGVRTPWDDTTDYVPPEIGRPETDAEKKLRWLEHNVKGSVAYLVMKGHRQLVMEALGLDRDDE